MFSNTKRVILLSLLASAANIAFAAPAPVSDLNSTATNSTSSSRSASNESDIERLERLLQNRNLVQLQMQQQIDDMALDSRVFGVWLGSVSLWGPITHPVLYPPGYSDDALPK